MAAFEDNNPFASPASPTSSRANSYAPFGSYPYSSQHNAQLSIDSTNRPATSSSEDAPAYQFRATNSDFSVEQNQVTVQDSGGGHVTGSRDKEGETCCKIDEIFRKNPEMRIVISEAGKASDGGANFIAYTIEVAGLTLRRRYSEFASLREALVRLFPTLIIPPIPEKHSMSDYAAAPRKATEDVHIIDHRKRMLQSFLNRLAQHPILRRDHVVHRFLTGDASWNEVLHSPPISLLPKNILKAPPLDPASADGDQRYKGMLLPKQSGKLKVPDEEDRYFTEMDAAAKEYEQVMGAGLEKVVRRLIKRYSDLSKDYEALGGAYNAFSLNENGGSLPLAIERVGQASDGTYLGLQELVLGLSSSFSEPLSESSQYAEILRTVLKYRRQKALQQELTKETLLLKKTNLTTLEKSEQEARRIEGALARIEGTQIIPRTQQPVSQETPEPEDEEEMESPTKMKPKKRLSVGKVFGFGKLNYAMKGIIDVDPETTRRNNIGKTKESITQLELSLSALENDVKVASEQIRHELERHQQMKETDLRKMMTGYARAMVEFGRKGLEQWEEAKGEIEKIR